MHIGYHSVLTAPVGIIRRVANRMFIRVIHRHAFILRPGLLGLEINSQIAVHNRRVLRQVPDVAAGDRINGIHQVIRLMQPVTLFLVSIQRSGSDPVKIFKPDDRCVLCS